MLIQTTLSRTSFFLSQDMADKQKVLKAVYWCCKDAG